MNTPEDAERAQREAVRGAGTMRAGGNTMQARLEFDAVRPMADRLLPVVGYRGGKRRLLPFIRPMIDVRGLRHYVEPFVGMGAVYLDLRARGYSGPAVLADNNTNVAAFWRMVHSRDAGAALLRAADALTAWPVTTDGFRAMCSASCDMGAVRIARFLWLTNYTFGNSPATYDERRGCWPFGGTKLTSATKWGKKFPWEPCIERLSAVVAILAGLPCEVMDCADDAICATSAASCTYADPPYEETRKYDGGYSSSFAALVASARGRVLLSEKEGATTPAGWLVIGATLAERVSQGNGAKGSRKEVLCIREAKP